MSETRTRYAVQYTIQQSSTLQDNVRHTSNLEHAQDTARKFADLFGGYARVDAIHTEAGVTVRRKVWECLSTESLAFDGVPA